MLNKHLLKYKNSIFCLSLVIFIILVYYRAAGFDFVNIDDPLQLTEQTHVLTGLTWSNFIWSFSPASWCSPLTWFGYTACHALFGLNPGAFHVLNLILHALNSILLFILLFRITGGFWKSAFVSALFALHPANVESVAWIAELNNVLSGLFFMLTLLAYTFYTEQPTWKRYMTALLLFWLGLLAKPSLMTLPFLLLLIDLWPLKRMHLDTQGSYVQMLKSSGTAQLSRVMLEKAPFLILAFLSFLSNMVGAQSRMGLYGAETISLGLRISNAIVSSVKYLGMLFWPHNLSILYPYPAMIPLWETSGALLVLTVLTVLALRLAARYPYFIVGWLWFLSGLAPFLGIFMSGVWPEMADRYGYLTFIGIFIALAWGIPDILRRWRHSTPALAIAGTGVTIFFAALAWTQVGYWKDSTTLFTHVVSVIDGKNGAFNNIGLAIAHSNLGNSFYYNGDTQGAIREYHKAIRINPYYDNSYYCLGRVLAEQGNLVEAAEKYRECIKVNPRKENVHNRLGMIMAEMGYYNEAIKTYLEGLQIDPHQANMYFNLGNAYLQKGNVARAVESYRQALNERPDSREARSALEKAQITKQKFDQLILALQSALQKEPGNPIMLTRLGDIYREQGDYENAISQYNKAISFQKDSIKAFYGLVLVYSDMKEYSRAADTLIRMKQLQPANPEIYYNLACLSAIQNRADESVAWLKQAIEKGFNRWDLIRKDPDLANVRSTAYVVELLRSHEGKVAQDGGEYTLPLEHDHFKGKEKPVLTSLRGMDIVMNTCLKREPLLRSSRRDWT